MKILKIYFVCSCIFLSFYFSHFFTQELNWKSIGPKGGNVSYLVSAPSDSNIVYATMRDGSIYRSEDAGQNWNIKNWLDGYVNSIDVYPFDPSMIYVIVSRSSGRTILKSTNGGESWFDLPWNFNYILNFTIDNINPDRMYATDFAGFYRTSDGGNQWYFNDSVYISTVSVVSNSTNILYGFSNLWKFYKSTNYGDTWNLISNLDGNPLWLEIDPVNNSILYLATSEGLFKSFNGGFNWIKKDDGEINLQHPWTSYVIINPYENNILFRSNNHEWTTYMSTNSGNYWKKIDLISGFLSIVGGDRLLSGTRDGIYSTPLSGEDTSYSSNGLNAVSIGSLIADENNAYSLYATYWDQGTITSYVYKYSDSGSWGKKYFDKGCTGLAMHSMNPNIIAAGLGFWNGVKISFDGGNNWELRGPTDNINYVKFSSVDSLRIFALGEDHLHYSMDLGMNWQIIQTPLNTHSYVHISLSDDENILLLSGDKGYDWNRRKILLISWNRGESWQEKDILSTVSYIFPGSEAMLAGTDQSLYRSIDNGVNWTVLNYPDNLFIRTFQSVDNGVVMGTSKGLFYTNNLGENWGEISSDIQHKHITSLAYSKYPQKILYAGTISGSVYYANIDTITQVKDKITVNKFYLSQNYPNPFNPTTTIQFRISKSEFVNLKVYDVLGNEIATLVNEEKPAGTYEVEFNSVGTSRDLSLSSGVYFYQLQTGGFVETKKMVLLR